MIQDPATDPYFLKSLITHWAGSLFSNRRTGFANHLYFGDIAVRSAYYRLTETGQNPPELPLSKIKFE
jgi:hypothetical protein